MESICTMPGCEEPLVQQSGRGRHRKLCFVCAGGPNASRQERLAARRRAGRNLLERLKDRPCADCHLRYPPYVMDFDHRDPKLKSFGLGSYPLNPVEDVLAEAAKCDVVCSNCHRVRTHSEARHARLHS